MVETRVLVLVKASPQPSSTYGDTVCVAGVNLSSPTPTWIRLYPVPFRYLDGDHQFLKYDTITVRTRSADADKRPESRKIDASSITVRSHLDQWRDRSKWIEPLPGPTMCELIAGARADVNAQSLGSVRVGKAIKLEFEEHPGWSQSERERIAAYQRQGSLFAEATPRTLLPPRLIVRLVYKCADSRCNKHVQRIIDWELTALQARFHGKPDSELTSAIQNKFFDVPFGQGREPMLFVGNQENIARRASFTVLGLYYPQSIDVERSQPLF